MKFLRQLLGITKLGEEKNQCIKEKTGAQNIVKEIKHYQKKWLQHVQRMDTNRIPKQELQYRPKGRRDIGRPTKRCKAERFTKIDSSQNERKRQLTGNPKLKNLLKKPANALRFMNVSLLHSNQRHVSATHVVIFRVMGTIIQIQL